MEKNIIVNLYSCCLNSPFAHVIISKPEAALQSINFILYFIIIMCACVCVCVCYFMKRQIKCL